MRRSLMLVLAVAMAALVFAPAAFAQDDNPTGDDVAASPAATSTASATPTASVTPTASAAAAQYEKSATILPDTGGSVPTTMLAIGVGALLVGGGLLARRFMG